MVKSGCEQIQGQALLQYVLLMKQCRTSVTNDSGNHMHFLCECTNFFSFFKSSPKDMLFIAFRGREEGRERNIDVRGKH